MPSWRGEEFAALVTSSKASSEAASEDVSVGVETMEGSEKSVISDTAEESEEGRQDQGLVGELANGEQEGEELQGGVEEVAEPLQPPPPVQNYACSWASVYVELERTDCLQCFADTSQR